MFLCMYNNFLGGICVPVPACCLMTYHVAEPQGAGKLSGSHPQNAKAFHRSVYECHLQPGPWP